MKILALVLCVAAAFLCGCATARVPGKVDGSVIDRVCDKFLPPDFHGPAHLEERGQYVTLVIDAGGLRRNADGRWTWDWLEYQRTVSVPLFSGVPYKQEGRVRLGARKEN